MAGGVVVSDVGTTDRQVLYARTVAGTVPCYTNVSVDNTRLQIRVHSDIMFLACRLMLWTSPMLEGSLRGALLLSTRDRKS